MPIETRQTMSKSKCSTKEPSGTNCGCDLAVILNEIKSLRKESAAMATEVNEIKITANELRASVEYTQEEVDNIKVDIASTKTELAEVKVSNTSLSNEVQSLKSKLLALERYSRNYNIRIGGVLESYGKDCMPHVVSILGKLGYSEVSCRNQIEIAHRTGRKTLKRPRHIIFKCFSRPFRADVLRQGKRNRAIFNDIYFIEDLTKEDQDLKQKALPLMSAGYEDGKKVTFRAGKLIINGVITHVPSS